MGRDREQESSLGRGGSPSLSQSSEVDRNLPSSAKDMGLIPGLGRFYMLQSN